MPRISIAFRAVPFSRFAEAADDAHSEKGQPYHLAYAEFVRYFADLDVVTPHNLIIGAHFIYGWMPTILTLRHDKTTYEEAAHLLTQLKHGAPLTASHLDSLASVINNSVVGTSKLLHVIRPNLYAIWDSRVCLFIYGKYMPDSRPREIDRYFAYLDNCRELAADPGFPAVYAKICDEKIGQVVQPFRAIEWVMYSAGNTLHHGDEDVTAGTSIKDA